MTEAFIFVPNSIHLKNEIIINIRDIYLVLSNTSDLSNNQKLALCNIQRYLIKTYLKQIIKRVDKK